MVTTGIEIDLFSSSSFLQGHPFEQYRWLRRNDPVHFHPLPGEQRGYWAVMRYEDLKAVSKDTQVFSSSFGMSIQLNDPPRDADGRLVPVAAGHMMDMDAPKHTAYRQLTNKGFTPRGAKAYQERIRGLARMIVDDVADRGECDLVEDVAGKLPSYFIADVLGIPLDDGLMLYDLTEKMHAAADAVAPADRMRAAQDMMEYAGRVYEDKSRAPGDDLSSKLVQSELFGEPLPARDFMSYFLLLVNAGGDTTRNLVAGGVDTLFEEPDQRRRLQDDLDLLPAAVEEMLRYLSPVVYQRRTAAVDTELAGKRIAAGDKVILYYGSANRDETAFADADRFDVARTPNEHVAFGGGGTHFCLGAHVARIEVQEMFRELLTRLPDIERAGPTEWLPSNFISGPKHLPVRFTPAPRLAV